MSQGTDHSPQASVICHRTTGIQVRSIASLLRNGKSISGAEVDAYSHAERGGNTGPNRSALARQALSESM